jgi:hypothetical protein
MFLRRAVFSHPRFRTKVRNSGTPGRTHLGTSARGGIWEPTFIPRWNYRYRACDVIVCCALQRCNLALSSTLKMLRCDAREVVIAICAMSVDCSRDSNMLSTHVINMRDKSSNKRLFGDVIVDRMDASYNSRDSNMLSTHVINMRDKSSNKRLFWRLLIDQSTTRTLHPTL